MKTVTICDVVGLPCFVILVGCGVVVAMFCRWSVDLVGAFPQLEYGNYYIMVMIEHISKWVEVVQGVQQDCQGVSALHTMQVGGMS